MKNLINNIKTFLNDYDPYINIWTVVVRDCNTHLVVVRLMFLRYKSAEKAFEDLRKQDREYDSYTILGGEPLFLWYKGRK